MAPQAHLSNREEEVVEQLLQGKSNKQIGSSLGISESTVEFHLKKIYAKFQVGSRTEFILKLGQSTVADKEELRQSTVADNGELAENRDRLNLTNRATSLRDANSLNGKEQKMETFVSSNPPDGLSTLTFFESIRVCLAKYAEFNGRASRSEFWWFVLFVTLVAGALAYMSETLSSVFLIATLLPVLAAGSRRLHDSGRSGWWQLFLLAPIAGIFLVGIMWALPPTSPLPDDTLPA